MNQEEVAEDQVSSWIGGSSRLVQETSKDDLIEEAAQDSGLTERLRQQLKLAEEASGHLSDAVKPPSPVASQMAQITAVMNTVTSVVKETPVEQIVVPEIVVPQITPVIMAPAPQIVQTIAAPVFMPPPIIEAPQIIMPPAPVVPTIVEAPVIPGLSLPILPSLP